MGTIPGDRSERGVSVERLGTWAADDDVSPNCSKFMLEHSGDQRDRCRVAVLG